MKTYKQFRERIGDTIPILEVIVVLDLEKKTAFVLKEQKWVTGRFPNEIRIDNPTHLHGNGQKHAHIFCRKGNEIGVINIDGSVSHKKNVGRLHKKTAAALIKNDFNIPENNIVEFIPLDISLSQLLVE